MKNEDGSEMKCCKCDRKAICRIGIKLTASGSIEGGKSYCEKHIPAKWRNWPPTAVPRIED